MSARPSITLQLVKKANLSRSRTAVKGFSRPPPKQNTSRQSPRLQTHAPSPSGSYWKDTLLFSSHIVFGLCAILWIRDHWFEIHAVNGSSMAPTLNPWTSETGQKDWILIKACSGRTLAEQTGKDGSSTRGINRNDVITFWKPHKADQVSLKRVVATEGDVVYPARGYVLDQETHRMRVKGLPDGLSQDDDEMDGLNESKSNRVVVPQGHVWVEGDNWRESLDSNDFGPVSKGLIVGKVTWMWRNWLRFERVTDMRIKGEEAMRSKVIYGQSVVPESFL